MAREAWTDERLDDLKESVNGRFDRVEIEMNARFDNVDKRFDSIDKRFDSIDMRFDLLHERFDSMQRTMIVCLTSITVSVVGAMFVSQF